MESRKAEKALLLQFNITQTLQIQLTRLKVYTYSRNGAKPFKCYAKFKHRRRHLQSHTGEKPFSCTLCHYKSAHKGNLNRHILTHAGNKQYSCAFCTNSFTTNQQKTRHENICKLSPRHRDSIRVKRQKGFKCQLCPYSAAANYCLKRHMMTHTGEKPFPCTLCHKTFRLAAILQSHIFTHTREKPHSCQFCARGFAQATNQKVHAKICKQNPKQDDAQWVEEQKKFKCKLCPYSTAQLSNLKRHVMSHTGEKPFPCNLCNQNFITGAELRIHIFTHTREKPHDCQFCKKGFTRASLHRDHEKTCKLNPKQGDAKWVEEQKKFKCHFCKYRTISKAHLESHLRSHTGEKPYSCPLCIFKSSQSASLHRHLRLKHFKEKGCECPNCDFATLSTSILLNHVKKSHVNTVTVLVSKSFNAV